MSDAVAGAIEAPPEAEQPRTSPALAGLTAHAKRLASANLKGKVFSMEIDGLRYTSVKLPAMAGVDLWGRLLALFGADVLRAMVTGDLGSLTVDGITRAAIRATQLGLVDMIRDLLAEMSVSELAGIKEAGPVTNDLDGHFAGEYLHLVKVCQFAMAHNLLGPTRGGR
jgi:hypothetical protein